MTREKTKKAHEPIVFEHTFTKTASPNFFLRRLCEDLMDALKVDRNLLPNLARDYHGRIDKEASIKELRARARNESNNLNRMVVTWKTLFQMFHMLCVSKVDMTFSIKTHSGETVNLTYHIDNRAHAGLEDNTTELEVRDE